MEHEWRDDSEVSERREPELICSLTLAALHTDQVVPRTPQEEQGGGQCYSSSNMIEIIGWQIALQ